MLGGAVAILVALPQPPWRLVAVVIFFVIAMNIESHILIPRIMAQVLGLSPLLTIVALLVGVKLMGILGGLLALPVAASLQEIFRETIREIGPGSIVHREETLPETGPIGDLRLTDSESPPRP
jgi:predicted PurR-regulated permease PerM